MNIMAKDSSDQGILKGEISLYHWPPVWLVRNQLYKQKFFIYLQNGLIQTSQTGGQWCSDTSPFSIPWFWYRSFNVVAKWKNERLHFKGRLLALPISVVVADTPRWNVIKLYIHTLRGFIISYSVCPWQTFPALMCTSKTGAYQSEAPLRYSTLG
jgi:hypothetical protein